MAFVEQEPFQKGRLNAAKASADFRSALAEAMRRSRVKYFTAEVAIEFMFASESPNAPHHHKLIKNYVDLIDEMLLRDDRQVRIIESTHLSRPSRSDVARRPLIQATVMPFRLYREKHYLLWRHDDDWYGEHDCYPEPLDYSVWNELIESATHDEEREALTAIRECEREEEILWSLTRRDNPIHNEILKELDLRLPRIPDPRELVFPLPLADCASTIEGYKRTTGVETIAHQIAVDLNIEIAHFPNKDIDNLYIDIVHAMRRSRLISSPIGDVRVYRIETDAGVPEARVKLLKPFAVHNYSHDVDEAMERALEALK